MWRIEPKKLLGTVRFVHQVKEMDCLIGMFGKKAGSTGVTGSRKSPSQDGTVTLPDPGFPDGDLTQLGYKLFEACGLTYVSYGPIGIEDHVRLLVDHAPAFSTTVASLSGSGTLGGRDDSAWIGFAGPEGSVVAYFAFPDADSGFLLEKVGDPIATMPEPLKWNLATVGAQVPTGVAKIFASGKAVPIWDLPGFADTRPAGKGSVQIPALLASRLNELGWNEIGENLFKGVVSTTPDRSQVLFFTSYNSDSFALMSPVSESLDGTVPEFLRGHSFGTYKLDVVAELVMLCDLLSAGPPSPAVEAIMDAGMALANFADRLEGDLSMEDKF